MAATQAGGAVTARSFAGRFDASLWILDKPSTALLLYIFAFWAAMLIGHGGGDLHTDTLEAYAWGKELQFGYPKHPPFWSWVAYGWFTIFPFSDWAAYLLGATNSAIGLGCTYLIARRFVSERQAMAALLCLMATPIYFCLANRYNANTALLSLWPATVLFALRAQESDRIVDGVFTGLLAGASLLSKYNSALFLAVLFLALPLRSSVTVWRSQSAIASYIVFAITLMPHLLWLHTHDYLPFTYFRISTARPFAVSLREVAVFPLTSLGLLLPGLAMFAIGALAPWQAWRQGLSSGWSADRLFVSALLFMPLFLTMLSCLLYSATLKSIYVIPMLFMASIWLAMIPGIQFDTAMFVRIRRGCAYTLIFYVGVAPVVGICGLIFTPSFATKPIAEVAGKITAEWHDRFSTPLRFVAGDEDYSIGASFYSPDHPSFLVGFDVRPLSEFGLSSTMTSALALSPWVRPQDLAQNGLAIFCSDEWRHRATECEERARFWAGEAAEEIEMKVAKTLFGFHGPVYTFRIFIIPPGSPSARSLLQDHAKLRGDPLSSPM